MEEWEKNELGPNMYSLTKYINFHKVRLIDHQKIFINDELQRFDVSKPDEKKELDQYNEILNPISSVLYMLDNPKMEGKLLEYIKINKVSKDEYLGQIMVLFWKVYNSYTDWKQIQPSLINDYVYLCYYFKHYIQGIYFAIKALELEEHSSYYDTVGEGWGKLESWDLSFEWHEKAYNFELKTNDFSFSHVCNYTRSAIKINKLSEASDGINTLLEKFPNEDYSDILKDYEALSKGKD
jgi:hypothetical protein